MSCMSCLFPSSTSDPCICDTDETEFYDWEAQTDEAILEEAESRHREAEEVL